ncbi:hypothetical protein BU24DRAFT_133450 [Aaosphaeria arxii CBS 175.79]|uniref:Uncharacterized protein n=1 Tax=Aaosphaeria arxii CBS 175.79 TaxID=1450172 RepID=A0A6A5Y3P9_9PLEO|nr:uncharacterized protein BU24DRAFT_133450 [Aaosphaeria arxii CBS 175.79]KAF2020098.1 hypothetical protein BU24DRAFT_133450 [Aaosphaeria arxii CBS 175.79]
MIPIHVSTHNRRGHPSSPPFSTHRLPPRHLGSGEGTGEGQGLLVAFAAGNYSQALRRPGMALLSVSGSYSALSIPVETFPASGHTRWQGLSCEMRGAQRGVGVHNFSTPVQRLGTRRTVSGINACEELLPLQTLSCRRQRKSSWKMRERGERYAVERSMDHSSVNADG